MCGPITSIGAIREYFGKDRKVELSEFQALSKEERDELGKGAAAELGKESYDILIGVGGGSSMDMTKGVSAILAHGGRGEDYSGVNKIPGPVIPIVAIPTTSGTGSEATRAAVFTDTEKGQKLALYKGYPQWY